MYMYIVGTPSNMVALCVWMLVRHLDGVEARVQDELQAIEHRAVEHDVAVDMRARQRADDNIAPES